MTDTKIPSPAELLEDPPYIFTSNYDHVDLNRFVIESLGKHKDDLKKGKTVCIGVSALANKDDIELLCSTFWKAGWKVSYLYDGTARPYFVYFSRPRFWGPPESH